MDSLVSARPIQYSKLVWIGEGSSGTVYRAKRKDVEFDLEQEVAVKILKSKIAVADWREEFSLLVRVNSQRCVRLLGWDYLQGHPALILELISGITLDRLLKEQRLTTVETEEIISQIFEGLHDISRAGLSHGDLSLKNVMVSESGEIKILDFGLFKGGNGRFTPEFAAPEIFEYAEPTFFSDLYSLGRIQFYMESSRGDQISSTTFKMLALRPEDRDFQLRHVSNDERTRRRMLLAARLKQMGESARIGTRGGTTIMRVGKWRAKRFARSLKVAVTAAVLLTIGSAPASWDHRPAVIYIRTSYWARVSVEGKEKGYSPLDLEVPAHEPLQLEILTPFGRFERTLTLAPGQNIVVNHDYLK